MEHEHPKAEVDFRELLRRPERLFGYSFVYVLATLLVLGVMYVANLTTVGKNSVPPLVDIDSTALVSDIPFQTPSVLPPVDVKNVAAPTDELLRKGRELYAANCSSCHGETGLGDGPAGLTLTPKPRNFHQKSGWTNGAKLSEIYRTLEEGIARSGMASFSYIPPYDRFALAHTVRSFQDNPPPITMDELDGLESHYQLSKGRSTPGQIPVRKATRLLLAESAPRFASIRRLSESISTGQDDPVAALLRRVVRDPERLAAGIYDGGVTAGGVGKFMRVVSADPAALGFAPSVLALTGAEWNSVYRFLTQRASRLRS